ncbi:MAG: acetate--CoA ligase family protein [Bacteroidetes bacterium]|nr:acetate--CoA ligase family protein [Bacteroidota bacterium]MBL6944670.1 acetate--CoA ligase family protein [Bacteroidales bacterium]
MNNNLNALFEPKAVAIVGASVKELSIGNVIIKNLLHYKYKGPIYPINPKVDEVRGIKAYKSILDVPCEVDLAHIVIPPPFVPMEVENCGKKGVKAIIINTAGFKEMGNDGKALEDDFLARAKKYGIRILGPNCQGIINSDPEINAYCNFTFTFFKPGYISVVAQSGGVGAVIMQAFHDMGIGMRMYVSNGNASDISIPEIIRHYGEDENTRAIVVYVESLDNPKEFLEIGKEVTAKKPILAMTAGRTEKGAQASRSHIGGLAGDISLEHIFRKAGMLPFSNQDDLCNAAKTFASQPIPNGNRVGIITNTGGPSVIAIDELVTGGLEVPPLSDKAKIILKETMFESASINNPLDVVATAGAIQFKSAFDVMMDEVQIDSVYVNFVTPPFVDCESVAREFAMISKAKKKPIVCNYMTDKEKWVGTTNILKEAGIPYFDFAETAAKALAAMVRYNVIRNKDTGKVNVFEDINKDIVNNILDKATRRKQEVLTGEDVYSILEAYKIPAANWGIANNSNEAVSLAEKLGFPVVIKADSEEIIHKSDVGGVAVNIKSSEDVRKVVETMKNKLRNVDLKFFVQKFMPPGRELIISAKKEEGLGHLIMFGMGGIFVEVYKDVVFNLTPVTDTEATEMLDSIKAAPLLNDFRGKKGIDKAKVSEILQRISALVTDFPAIKELDLNPIFAYEDKVCAVDARIIL